MASIQIAVDRGELVLAECFIVARQKHGLNTRDAYEKPERERERKRLPVSRCSRLSLNSF